jgi:transposase
VLGDAGIKLSSVASQVMGISSLAILRALVAGERDPEALAELAKGTLRRKLPALREALVGRVRDHHALLVGEILAKLDYLDEAIGRLSAEIERVIAPFGPQVELLRSIPGVDRRMAEALIAEIGVDMARFGTAARLASWAGICPGQHESAGRQRRSTTPQGLRVAAPAPHPGRQGGGPHQGDLPVGAVRAPSRPARRITGDDRRGPFDPGGHLPHPGARHAL